MFATLEIRLLFLKEVPTIKSLIFKGPTIRRVRGGGYRNEPLKKTFFYKSYLQKQQNNEQGNYFLKIIQNKHCWKNK